MFILNRLNVSKLINFNYIKILGWNKLALTLVKNLLDLLVAYILNCRKISKGVWHETKDFRGASFAFSFAPSPGIRC